MARAMTTEELKAYWDDFAESFEQEQEREMLPIARSLVGSLGLDRLANVSILEVGCGAGGAAAELLKITSPTNTLTLTDLSPEMVRLARRKLPENVSVFEADAESLPFPEAFFDIVYSNLCLQLVNDTDKMIAELFRVLRPGGPKEDSPKFTILPSVCKSLDIAQPDGRSNFHLNDAAALRARFASRGFQRVVRYLQPSISTAYTGEEFVRVMLTNAKTRKTFEALDEEKKAVFLGKLSEAAEATLAEGRPIILTALVVVAQKPQSL